MLIPRSLAFQAAPAGLQHSVNWKARVLALGLSARQLSTPGQRATGRRPIQLLDMIEVMQSLGTRLIDDLPYIRAEVVYACRHEMAMTPYDVLARRTSITLEDRQRGLGIVEEVAALMATELDGHLSNNKP